MAELPWLPLPPGEARCCFLRTRKLAPTLQIMINMLLNGIIVLSNCEMLTLDRTYPLDKQSGFFNRAMGGKHFFCRTFVLHIIKISQADFF